MNIKQYLDSTYLKTAEQSLISEKENVEIVKAAIMKLFPSVLNLS